MTKNRKIKILKEWLNSRRYRLIIKPDPQIAEINFDEQVVYVPDNNETIALLLHECGHLFCCIVKHHDPLTIVEEEMSAWRQGRLLAEKLNIPLPRNYWKVARECLKTYLC